MQGLLAQYANQLCKHLFSEVERFFNQTGTVSFIIVTGGTLPLEGEIDLTELDVFVTAMKQQGTLAVSDINKIRKSRPRLRKDSSSLKPFSLTTIM